jgi:hypothetical protein
MTITGVYMDPPDQSLRLTTYPPAFSFTPTSIGDEEIDGYYSIDCSNTNYYIGYVLVTTSSGQAYSPDFDISPY